ncbi:hypothetical protein [Herpetosiphon sp.]|uniref:hypothetical protein n=1 Tax=Herpetosiphon sp. TaxID=71864 RepID=UPI0003131A8E|nr:hypothetical protein [Herpetosiphon sp.]
MVDLIFGCLQLVLGTGLLIGSVKLTRHAKPRSATSLKQHIMRQQLLAQRTKLQ